MKPRFLPVARPPARRIAKVVLYALAEMRVGFRARQFGFWFDDRDGLKVLEWLGEAPR